MAVDYDPQKAHEYYERHKKLKGRRSTSGFSSQQKEMWSYAKDQLKTQKKTRNETNRERINKSRDEQLQRLEEAKQLDYAKDTILYSQTTKSLQGFREIVAYIESHKTPETEFRYYDTICRQVANRIPNIRTFAAKHDLIFFVCGKKSSNGKILFNECKSVNSNSYLIEDAKEIDFKLLDGVKSVGICGATSTPKWLMESCKECILNTILA